MARTQIRFYRATGMYGFLSNLFLRECLVVPGRPPEEPSSGARYFRSAEDAYQYSKPRKRDVADWLMQAPAPYLVAYAAHGLPGWAIRGDWAAYKQVRMAEVLRAKFTQHVDLRTALVETGDAELVEESKTDAFWGIGARGKGRNMLGVMLMALRGDLA